MIIFVVMDKDRLIKEYVGGKAISALSREFGVARTTVIRHLKSAGVYDNATGVALQSGENATVSDKSVAKSATVDDQNATVGDRNATLSDKGATVDIYAYASSLSPLGEYDNGAGSVCPVKGNRYYFELLDMWLPVVRDEGPLREHVEYLPSGKRFKRSHPDHPDNAWKRDPSARHPYMV